MKWKIAQLAVFMALFVWAHYRIINKAGLDDFLRQGPMIPLIVAGCCFILTCIIFGTILRLQVWYHTRRSRRHGAGRLQ